jgi:type I restriction enzyme R subunit
MTSHTCQGTPSASAVRTEAAAQPAAQLQETLERAQVAAEAIELDEADTRRLIDGHPRDAGWEADTENLRYGKGARPQRGGNLAIAEWPTAAGPADYVLFAGLTPLPHLPRTAPPARPSACRPRGRGG